MANLWQAVEAASNRAAGAVGRAIDVVGNKASAYGIKGPELQISENLEQRGANSLTTGQRIDERISQNKPIAAGDVSTAIAMGKDPKTLNFENKGINTTPINYGSADANSAQAKVSNGGLTGNKQFTANELSSLGLSINLYGGQEVVIGGQKYRVKDNGNNTRSFEAISNDSGGGGGRENIDVGGTFKKAGNGTAMDFLNQSDVDAILSKYSQGAFARGDDLAAEIERVATENADREYRDMMSALGGQKEEVGRLGKQQTERALIQKELSTAELDATSDKEQKSIEKQRAGFIEENSEDKDQLGRAWRDMSLEIQRVMRGKGTSDSSHATGEEVKVLREFNQGLRKLTIEKSSALRDLSEAAIETVNFYQRKKVELAEQVRTQLEDVDNWVRQQTTSIQNQEKVAVSKKLADINNALLEAKRIKTDIANQVAQTELNFGMWLEQTKISYQMAVAEAAKGKVETAGQSIAKAAQLSKDMATLLENGQAQWATDKNGNTVLQDIATGAIIPVRPGYKDEYEEQKALDLQKAKIGATPSLDEQINSLIQLPGGFSIGKSSGVSGAINSAK